MCYMPLPLSLAPNSVSFLSKSSLVQLAQAEKGKSTECKSVKGVLCRLLHFVHILSCNGWFDSV